MKKYRDVITFAFLAVANMFCAIFFDLPKGLTIFDSFVGGSLTLAALLEWVSIYFKNKHIYE